MTLYLIILKKCYGLGNSFFILRTRPNLIPSLQTWGKGARRAEEGMLKRSYCVYVWHFVPEVLSNNSNAGKTTVFSPIAIAFVTKP